MPFDWWFFGKIVIKAGSKFYEFKNKRELQIYCDKIINEYELEFCKTVGDFQKNFNRVPSHKKTIFYRHYPWIEEYLDHAKYNSETPFDAPYN